jgi:glycosyltransferase involved in cell wall biosynthesis
MNIALISSAFHPSVGGVEELVRQLALEQRRRGWGTVVSTHRWPRDLPDRATIDGIPVRRYAFRVAGGNFRRNLAAFLLAGPELNKLCRDLTQDAIELLHIQCISCNAPYALRAARRLNLPLVVTLQGELTMDANQSFARKESDRQMYREMLASADAITACSRQTLDEAEQFFGQPLSYKSRVVYNGVRLEEFATATPHPWPRPYILAIGRHVPQKGFDVLLQAFAKANPDSHDLLLAGDGPNRAELEALTKQLGLNGKVHFLGRVDHDQAVRLFTGCAFFILPSRHEPMGIVNLEAMAAGKPVIATHVGGVPELVINGETGLLIPGDNVPALATAITQLTTDGDMRHRFGENGRRRAQQFSWLALADQYEEVYRQAIAARRQGRKIA